MHIKCPYCGCDYDIRSNTLGEPIGNIQLGYGWWLRCYKCHKKFWLSSSKVINFDLSPVKADKQKKIEELKNLIPNKQTNKKLHKIRISKWLFILTFLSIVILGVYKRHALQNFIDKKLLTFVQKNATNLQLKNVSYRVYQNGGQTKLYLCGYVVNNTKSIMSFNYLRVYVTFNQSVIANWNIEPNIKNIIPGDKIFFASDVFIKNFPPDFKINIVLM